MRTVVARLRNKIIKGDRLGKREISKEKREMNRKEKGDRLEALWANRTRPKTLEPTRIFMHQFNQSLLHPIP